MKRLIVYKGRTNIISVSLGVDVSADTFVSQIRSDKTRTSPLIATWDITKVDGGVSGELVLTLDDAVTTLITKTIGYMDIKRVTAGEPVPVFDDPIEVVFRDSITA